MYYLLGIGMVSLVIAQHAFRRGRAKAAVQSWIGNHHYRLISLDSPWVGTPGFASSWTRDSDDAFDFRAEVADQTLGGTGNVFLRVWVTWLGDIKREIEVVWRKMPAGGIAGSQPLWERLADAQLDVLRRISDGEAAFHAPRNPDASGTEFSELAEHILALSRRGMLTCGSPRMDDRNANRYVSIADIELTDEGRLWLKSSSWTSH